MKNDEPEDLSIRLEASILLALMVFAAGMRLLLTFT